MALEVGSRLGHYDVTALIGEGGMGQVYQATDTKLNRQVALKILPEAFATDPDRLARFQRETQVLASLNHPNIAQIHGLEECEGTRALVLELVEGPTLADRIAQGPIPVDEALPIAKQIAEALEAAHEQGIVHRDLKPANIKVRDDGTVKVLDFGLAKALDTTVEGDPSQSPTLTAAATQMGVILGTAAYMSPEQAKGKTADRRSDVWAFGAVLYEMLSGRRAFVGEDVSDTLVSVFRDDPDWSALPNDVLPRVSQALQVCLQKDPTQRVRDISAIRLALEGAFETTVSAASEPMAVQTASQSKLPWVAAFILGAIIAGLAVWSLTGPEPSGQVTRFSQVLPESQRFTRTGRPVVAVSPNGSRLVYVANRQLFFRAMDTLQSSPIAGTDEDPSAPFFSPDGEWIGYWSGEEGQLKKIAVSGGAAVTLCDAGNPQGRPVWGADETIVWSQGEGIMRVSANGGTPERLISGSGLVHPQMLPGEDSVLFSIAGPGSAVGAGTSEVVVQSLESDVPKTLFPGGFPRYLRTGHIVYQVDDVLFAVPFDLDSLEVTGGPVALLDGVRGNTAAYDFSESGWLVYVSGEDREAQRRLVWVDRNGVAEPLETIPPGPYQAPRLSPNEERVLVVADNDVWIYDIATGRRSAVTTDGLGINEAEWDPTGTQIAFSSQRAGTLNVFVQPADGSGTVRQLTSLEGSVEVDSWSPNGDVMAPHHHSPEGPTNILMIPVGEEGSAPQDFLVREFNEQGSVFSPDGRYVAYSSNESGQDEVYIRPYPGPGSQVTVSVGGGTEPVWRDGELFYRRTNDDRMMAVSVRTGPELNVGDITELFEGDYWGFDTTPRPDYHVTADRSRFLMLTGGADTSLQEAIVVVQNWSQELLERVPVD